MTLNGRRWQTVHHRYEYFRHHGLDLEDPELKKMVVDHLCRNPACINVDHLELVTHQENSRRGLACGETHPQGKLGRSEVVEIRRLYATGNWRQVDLAELYSVSQPSISAIIRRQTWDHLQ